MEHKFPVHTIVDLFDNVFQQWRGEYMVAKTPDDKGLYEIRNTKTNSKQKVKESSLRIGRLPPFRLGILYDKKD